MRAVILAGGKGTRLLPYTTILPKPLMPVGERAILEILIRQLQECGFNNLTICLGHLAHIVQSVLSNGNKFRSRITYSIEDVPLGTSGPLSLVPGLDGTFMVVNGDVLCNLDYGELIRFHRSRNASLTIATHQRTVHVDYGIVHTSGDRLTKYEEKPVIKYQVSMGVYVFEPSVLKYIPPCTYLDFPDLVQTLLRQGEHVCQYPFDGIWFDLGRIEDFQEVHDRYEDLKKAIPFLE